MEGDGTGSYSWKGGRCCGWVLPLNTFTFNYLTAIKVTEGDGTNGYSWKGGRYCG